MIDPGGTIAVVTVLYSAASRSAPQPAGCAGWIEQHPLQPHATGRLRPEEITLFPPLIDGPAASSAVSESLRYRESLIGPSVRIETSHARLVSSLTRQVSLRPIWLTVCLPYTCASPASANTMQRTTAFICVSDIANGYFQIAVDVYTNLRYNADEWE